MNPYDKEIMELHIIKTTMFILCFVIVTLIIAGAHFLNSDAKKIEVSSEVTATTTPVINDTTVEETTIPEETTSVIETTTPPETTNPDPPVVGAYLTLTESERLILATLIRLECGGSSYECQMAVASVVINRMNMWGLTLRQVVFQENVFSPAYLIDKETGASYYPPYETCWQVVDDICANGPTLPYYVIYFRADYYHSWATPYKKIGDLYFSYAEKYK